jgi:nucleoside-diphosphate kinase
MEQSFVMLKPGVLQRRIVGEIISRLERKGLCIIALKLMRISPGLAETHYAEHRGKAFYEALIAYTISAPVIALVVEGEGAVAKVRRLAGPTNTDEALPGTIRGDYAAQTKLNIIHASDSAESAEREIALFFDPEELYPWKDGNGEWF